MLSRIRVRFHLMRFNRIFTCLLKHAWVAYIFKATGHNRDFRSDSISALVSFVRSFDVIIAFLTACQSTAPQIEISHDF